MRRKTEVPVHYNIPLHSLPVDFILVGGFSSKAKCLADLQAAEVAFFFPGTTVTCAMVESGVSVTVVSRRAEAPPVERCVCVILNVAECTVSDDVEWRKAV